MPSSESKISLGLTKLALLTTHWNAGEPNNSGGEGCTVMYQHGPWNDWGCHGKTHAFVCKLAPMAEPSKKLN